MSDVWKTSGIFAYVAIIMLAGFAVKSVDVIVAVGIFVCLMLVGYSQALSSRERFLGYVGLFLSVILAAAYIYAISPAGSILNRDILYFSFLTLSVSFIVPAARDETARFTRSQKRLLLICLVLGIGLSMVIDSRVRPHLTAHHGLAFLLLATLLRHNAAWFLTLIFAYVVISLTLGQSQNFVFLIVWMFFYALSFVVTPRWTIHLAATGVLVFPIIITALFSAGYFAKVEDFNTKARAYFTYSAFEHVYDDPFDMRFGQPVIPFELGLIGRSKFRGSIESIADIGTHNFVTSMVAKMGLLGLPLAAALIFASFAGFATNDGRLRVYHPLLFSYVVAFVFVSLSVNEAALSFVYQPVLLLPAIFAMMMRSS